MSYAAGFSKERVCNKHFQACALPRGRRANTTSSSQFLYARRMIKLIFIAFTSLKPEWQLLAGPAGRVLWMIPAKERAAASGVPINTELSPDMPLESFKVLINPQANSREPSHRKETAGGETSGSSGERAGEVADYDTKMDSADHNKTQQQSTASHHRRSPASKRPSVHPKPNSHTAKAGGSLAFPSLAVFESDPGDDNAPSPFPISFLHSGLHIHRSSCVWQPIESSLERHKSWRYA